MKHLSQYPTNLFSLKNNRGHAIIKHGKFTSDFIKKHEQFCKNLGI
jgi:hypothetical protein